MLALSCHTPAPETVSARAGPAGNECSSYHFMPDRVMSQSLYKVKRYHSTLVQPHDRMLTAQIKSSPECGVITVQR